MILPLHEGYLEIRGNSSFLLIGKVLKPFHLFIETYSDEYSQYLENGDLIIVSAPEGGAVSQAMILLELIRKYHAPLVVLPKNHPGSHRLKMVVSAGPEILLSCSIQRGTHPEQHLLCASEELSGIIISKNDDSVRLDGNLENIKLISHQSDTMNFDL